MSLGIVSFMLLAIWTVSCEGHLEYVPTLVNNMVLLAIIYAFAIAAWFIFIYFRRNQVRQQQRYDGLLTAYFSKKQEIEQLKGRLDALLEKADDAVAQTVKEGIEKESLQLDDMIKNVPHDEIVRKKLNVLAQSPVSEAIVTTLRQTGRLPEGDSLIEQAEDLLKSVSPSAYELLITRVRPYSDKNYRICLLLVFGLKARTVAKACCCEAQNVTNVKARVSQSLFGVPSAKGFVERVVGYNLSE